MKKNFTLLFVTISLVSYAQPKLITQAIVTTKTTITAPENDENNAAQNNISTTTPDGAEVRVVRFGGDGETKSTTWLKNDMTKTFSESEMGQNTVIRDNSKKITTTIIEMMGRKTGTYAKDAEQAEMRQKLDSMMRSRGQNISIGSTGTPPSYSVVNVDGQKKIAGYNCNKALLIAKRGERSDTTHVWYCPDLKLQNLPSTGGMGAGLGAMMSSGMPSGMELLNGFPLLYERDMNRGRHMKVEVTKLVIDKEVADKEFEIPKDIELKSAKEMQNGMGGGTFQMRIGG